MSCERRESNPDLDRQGPVRCRSLRSLSTSQPTCPLLGSGSVTLASRSMLSDKVTIDKSIPKRLTSLPAGW